MKIAIGGISHETNTFSVLRTNLPQMREQAFFEAGELIDGMRTRKDYISGMIVRSQKDGVVLVPSLYAFNSGPLITKECYSTLRDKLLKPILAKAGELDGICLSLHGAAVSEGEHGLIEDLEGDILLELRKNLGKVIPIVVALDLHGNITKTMVDNATALCGVKQYPHVDTYETGFRAMDILIGTIKGEISPVMGYVKLPLMIAPPIGCTYEAPLKAVMEYADNVASSRQLLDCTFFHGFPYSDISSSGASVVCVHGKERELAEMAAADVSDYVFKRRKSFNSVLDSVEEGLQKALQIEGGPIAVNETSDNPGGGAPGDGTHLLRKMIEMNVPKSCFGCINDPEVVEIAHRAGVGKRINISLGGKTDDIHGKPIEIEGAYVKCLTDGRFTVTGPVFTGATFQMEKTCRLQVGNVDIIVVPFAFQTLDDQVFILHGIDIADYKLVALKSSNHFKGAFRELAKAIVTVDPPGIHTANLEILEFKNVPRPIFPLDDI